MNKRETFILLYNGSVQFPSFDIKVLWLCLDRLTKAINAPAPHSYVQVTRILNEKPNYVHSPIPGHCWEIIKRPFLYSRRKARKGNTTPAAVTQSQQS